MVSKMTTETMPSHILSPTSALRRRKSQRALLKAKRVSFHQEMASADDDSPHHFSREEFVKAILSQAKEINLDLEGEYFDDDERSINSLGDLLVAEPRGPPGCDDSMPGLLSLCNQSSTVSLLSMQSLSCLGHDDSSGAIQMTDFTEDRVTDLDMEGLTCCPRVSRTSCRIGKCHP
jgi:hypothetical protein